MFSNIIIAAFTNAAKALAVGAKDTGLTSNALRKLDWRMKDDSGNMRSFTALEQNPNKLSTPAKLAREGHTIIQIRDNDAGRLVGNVDLEENRFNSYDDVPNQVDFSEILEALGDQVVKPGEVKVTAARTATNPKAA